MNFFSWLMLRNFGSQLKTLLNAFSQMVSIISMNVNKNELFSTTKGFTIVHCRLGSMVHGSNLN